MKAGNQSTCRCARCVAADAGNLGELGLDELMIVNPASDATGPAERYFLGDDGTLYLAEDLRNAPPGPPAASQGKDARGEAPGLSNYFLGADGALYEVTAQGGNPFTK